MRSEGQVRLQHQLSPMELHKCIFVQMANFPGCDGNRKKLLHKAKGLFKTKVDMQRIAPEFNSSSLSLYNILFLSLSQA